MKWRIFVSTQHELPSEVHSSLTALAFALAACSFFWISGCATSEPVIYEESSPLEWAGPYTVPPPQQTRELPPLPPTPPVPEAEKGPILVEGILSGLIPCDQVLLDGRFDWYTDIDPGYFEGPHWIIWEVQFDLYEEPLQALGMQEVQSVFLENRIPMASLELADNWVKYKKREETRYVIKFCNAYWDVSQDGYQISANRLATPLEITH